MPETTERRKTQDYYLWQIWYIVAVKRNAIKNAVNYVSFNKIIVISPEIVVGGATNFPQFPQVLTIKLLVSFFGILRQTMLWQCGLFALENWPEVCDFYFQELTPSFLESAISISPPVKEATQILYIFCLSEWVSMKSTSFVLTLAQIFIVFFLKISGSLQPVILFLL